MLVALYPSKRKLKDALGENLNYQETSLFGSEYQSTGTLYVVGPTATNRKWYAQVTMFHDKIVKVK